MLVSWNWLKDYVDLNMSHDELVERLTMSGLNHEGSDRYDGDRVIDLEVTSNRPDCLGHLGVAREISVLFDVELKKPDPRPAETGPEVDNVASIEIKCPQLCPRYTGRVIRGVKIGPSPDWIADRLEAVGCNLINNVVDITNFVLLESGQPIHAFDLSKLGGRQIIVREPYEDETFVAIDHKEYALRPGMCVIADADKAVALGGVMGGADSEVSEATTEILVEVAAFDALSIRATSRALNLKSDASYRFERPTDPDAVDWASRRCCELILKYAGGELSAGIIDAGHRPPPRESLALRLDQVPRVLGIDVRPDEIAKILAELGNRIVTQSEDQIEVIPPTWRSDLAREIDLIEEVARIHGYDRIPEDVQVPMTATIQRDQDRIVARCRTLLTAAGFDEAITASLLPDVWQDLFSPWSDAEPIRSNQPMLGVLDRTWQNEGPVISARRSLIPCLLEARRYNEYRSNARIELFELARVYLSSEGPLPDEPWKIAITSGRDFVEVKGIVETLILRMNPSACIDYDADVPSALNLNESCRLSVNGQVLGWVGSITDEIAKRFKLQRTCVIAELDLARLGQDANLVPVHRAISLYPAVARDFNFVVGDQLRWADLERSVRRAGGEFIESVEYRETFRDPDKDGADRKRLLLSITLRALDSTLTGEQVDATCQRIVTVCQQEHQAELLS